MTLPVGELADRLDQFCRNFEIPKRFWGSLGMTASMAWTLGATLSVKTIRLAHPGDFGLDKELLP